MQAMLRAGLLLRAVSGALPFGGGDDTSLLLQSKGVFHTDDDLSALQAPNGDKARSEVFKAHAKGARLDADEARRQLGLAQVKHQDLGTDKYYPAPWYDVPDKHTVSVLQGGIKQPSEEPVMTICNGYAFPEPIDVKLLRTGEHLLDGLTYKDCADLYDLQLRYGDELEFQARGSPLGVFRISGIPEGGSQLLLVPHRKHPDNYQLKFASHAFVREQHRQPTVATIDAYAGNSSSFVRLVQDSLKEENVIRVENISYGTVAVVTVGHFQVQLVGHQGDLPIGYTNVSTALGNNYVVLRVGGGRWPEELVVYPTSAASSTTFSLLLSAVLLLVLHLRHG